MRKRHCQVVDANVWNGKVDNLRMRYRAFADVALSHSRCRKTAAVRRVPPIRSFAGLFLAGIQALLLQQPSK